MGDPELTPILLKLHKNTHQKIKIIAATKKERFADVLKRLTDQELERLYADDLQSIMRM